MSRDPKLNQDEKDQIKALSTAGYTLKQISDVVKRSKKAVSNLWRMLKKSPNIVRSQMKKYRQLTQTNRETSPSQMFHEM
uniref:HTH_38 domain-containing protein n=1 Tax=Heterorhabditis bacteriophora TaxID=37862 RepID=A0A1I7W6J2_HETBA